jgi:hypothetical protein
MQRQNTRCSNILARASDKEGTHALDEEPTWHGCKMREAGKLCASASAN